MISVLLATVALAGQTAKGFTSSLDQGSFSKVFEGYFLREYEVNTQMLRANGVPTGIVFPESLEVYTAGFDSKGRPVGGIKGSVSGARIVVLNYGVMFTGKGYEVVYPLPKFRSTQFVAVRKPDQILGIAYNDGIPNMDGPEDDSHGFLISEGRTHDLGPASEVKFLKDGTIEGSYIGDADGRPYNVTLIGSSYRHTFTWKDGVRRAMGKKPE